jgi:hypothetical protein
MHSPDHLLSAYSRRYAEPPDLRKAFFPA